MPTSHADMTAILDAADVLPHESVAEQLSHNQMMALSCHMALEALEEHVTAEQAARMVGFGRGLRQLARLKGEEWNPPEPDNLSIIGFMARQAEKEWMEA